MSTIIKLKRSTSSGSVPTTSDLQDGEVALNVIDKKMFVRNGGTIVTVANFSSGGGGGGGSDLTAIDSTLTPDTDVAYDVGTLAASFRNLIFGNQIKKKVRVFTNAGGLGTTQANFGFNINTGVANFQEVFTNAGGLSESAISTSSTFDDSNPAFIF